jgi:hypothetical protein
VVYFANRAQRSLRSYSTGKARQGKARRSLLSILLATTWSSESASLNNPLLTSRLPVSFSSLQSLFRLVWHCGLLHQPLVDRSGPGLLSRYSDSLRTGRSVDRSPVGARFSHPSRPALGPIQPPIQWVPDLFSGSKAVTPSPHILLLLLLLLLLLQLGFHPVAVVLHYYRQNNKNKTTKNYKTIKVSTQTEHRKYKYNTYYKNTHQI